MLQTRRLGQRVETLRGAQVGEKVHLLAQAQQAAFGLHREIEIVVFGAANGAEQNGVNLLRLGHGVVMQRRAVGVIGRAADEIFGHVEG